MKKSTLNIFTGILFLLILFASCDKKHNKVHSLDGIKAEIKEGKVFLSLEKDLYNTIINDAEFKAEQKITGLEANVKSVYIGRNGNDFNPLLCMLLEDGTVQAIEAIGAYFKKDFTASEKLPGLVDIQSFETEKIEDSEVIYYVTFAVDKAGKKYDVSEVMASGETNENEISELSEDQAIKMILNLPEIKAMENVSAMSNGVESSERGSCWFIQVGQNSEEKFTTEYSFFVYNQPRIEIKYYDVVEDAELSLDEWRESIKY